MTLAEKQQEFIDLFNELGEWPNRFTYLMAIGDEMQPMPAHLVMPENKISGCMSNSYFCCTYIDNVAHIYGQSNASIPSGIIAVIHDIFNGCSRDEIRATIINFHTETKLIESLTPARAGALEQMITKILSS